MKINRFILSATLISGCVMTSPAYSVGWVLGVASGIDLASETTQFKVISQYPSSFGSSSTKAIYDINRNIEAIQEDGGLKKKMWSKLFSDLNDSLYSDFVELGKAQQKAEARRQFGEQSRTTSVCDVAELSDGLKKGKQQEKEVAKKTAQSFDAWEKENQVIHRVTKKISRIPLEDISNTLIKPANGTLTEKEVEQATLIYQIIMNPFPMEKIEGKIKDTKQGELLDKARKLRRAGQLTAESVINQIIAEMAPTHKNMSEWAKELWLFMGESGEPPQLVEGKLSFDGIFELLLDSKFNNYCWQLKAEGLQCVRKDNVIEPAGNDVWVTRQLLLTEALSLEIKKRQLFYSKKIAELLSEKRASQVAKESQSLDILYKNAISQIN